MPPPKEKPFPVQAKLARPDGRLIWAICEVPGEAGPAPAIAAALSRRLDAPVTALVTPVDPGPLVPAVASDALHQPVPADSSQAIHDFIEHWSPDFGVVVGRPHCRKLIERAVAEGVPMFHAAATRKAEQSASRPPDYLRGFHTLFAPSASEANVLRPHVRSGEARVEITGPLSDTVFALPCNEAECDELARLLGGRPVWLAAEVGRAEVEVLEAAHRKAFRSAHRLLLIIVPRDIGEADAILAELEARSWRVARRAELEEPDPEIQVYLADTDEELGLWYRLAPASFIGGTLFPDLEPTDPYAPAALGSAVLHGPHTGSNPARFEALAAHGASVPIVSADELGAAVISLLAPDKAASLAQAGWATTTESAHVVERMADVMAEIMETSEASS